MYFSDLVYIFRIVISELMGSSSGPTYNAFRIDIT